MGTVPLNSKRRYAFNLNLYIFGEAGHFNAASRRTSFSEHLGVDPVKRDKVIHVLDKHGRLNDIGKRRSGRFKNILQIGYNLTGLIFNGYSVNGISRRIDRNLTGAEYKTAYLKSLTVGT